jgi:hypothetical protein
MTDYNKKFDIQLKQGQKLEEQLEAFFTGQSIEVKSERYIWEITGNLFIEYEYKGQPSGIAVTTSDYWALCLVRDEQLMQMYILPTDTLRRITRRYWDTNRNVIGGDLKKSKGILVPIDDIAHGYKF